MSRAELDAYSDALARLNGHKTGQKSSSTTHVKSARRKKTGNAAKS